MCPQRPLAGTVFTAQMPPASREGRSPRALIPLHPLLVSAVQEHVLRGHVDNQGHGGVGLPLVTGRKQAGLCWGQGGTECRPRTGRWEPGPALLSNVGSHLPPGGPSSPPEGGVLTQRLDEPFVWTFYHNEGDPGVRRGADLFRKNLSSPRGHRVLPGQPPRGAPTPPALSPLTPDGAGWPKRAFHTRLSAESRPFSHLGEDVTPWGHTPKVHPEGVSPEPRDSPHPMRRTLTS